MTEECIGGVNLERFAEFVVDHAEEFPECLPLLKEAFQALSTAERKIAILKQCFIKHYNENRRKSSKSFDDHEDSSTIAKSSSVIEYCTEPEDGELIKQKENSRENSLDKSENDIKAERSLPHQPECGQSTGFFDPSLLPKKRRMNKNQAMIVRKNQEREAENRRGISPSHDAQITSANTTMDSEELKEEETYEKNVLLNIVVDERDPLIFKTTNSEASLGSRVVSSSPRKRSRSISSESPKPPRTLKQVCNVTQAPSSVTQKEISQKPCKSDPELQNSTSPSTFSSTGPPGLRVIPSALLMENPEQLNTQPLDNKYNSGSSGLHDDHGVPKSNNAVGSKRIEPCILYFDISREIDKRNWLTETDIIVAIKKDPVLRGCWITVDSMKRVNNLITGHLIFPDVSSCFRVHMTGILLNGFRARLKPVDAVGYHGSFAQDTSSTSSSSRPHLERHGIQGPASSHSNSSNESWLKRTCTNSQPPAQQRSPMPQHQRCPPPADERRSPIPKGEGIGGRQSYFSGRGRGQNRGGGRGGRRGRHPGK